MGKVLTFILILIIIIGAGYIYLQNKSYINVKKDILTCETLFNQCLETGENLVESVNNYRNLTKRYENLTEEYEALLDECYNR